MLVDVVFQQAVKAAYSSLQLHYEHDRMSHTVHHHGRLASWAERCAGNIDDDTYRRATRAHQLAGRLKHTVSERASRVYSSSCDESVFDELYTCDPWAGKTIAPSRYSTVCYESRGDAWKAWSERKDQAVAGLRELARGDAGDHLVVCDMEAAEVGVRAVEVGQLTALVEIVTNEAGWLVGEAVRNLARRFEEEFGGGGAPPCSGEEEKEEEKESDGECAPPCSGEEEEVDMNVDGVEMSGLAERLEMHAASVASLVRNWEIFEGNVRADADALASHEERVERGCGDDDDDFWNEELDMASRLEYYADVLGLQPRFSGEEVELALKMENELSYENVVETIREAGIGYAAPAGAWVIALGTSCVGGGMDGTGLEVNPGPSVT